MFEDDFNSYKDGSSDKPKWQAISDTKTQGKWSINNGTLTGIGLETNGNITAGDSLWNDYIGNSQDA